jgi:hypothetical protein
MSMRRSTMIDRLWSNATVALLALSAVSLGTARSGAQCTFDWLPGEGAPGVVGIATVFASTTWDADGAGPRSPQVVFGGTILAAGNVSALSVAAWDGAEWHAFGDGLNAQVRDLTVFNGELVAAAGHNGFGNPGPANGVARWDGTSWHPIGAPGFQNVVRGLAVYNGDLIAGGLFTSAGGTPVNNVARWDGTNWQPMGAGITNGVNRFIVFNGELLAAGVGVFRWNGTSWQPFGPSFPGSVFTLATYNGQLVMGGSFRTNAGGPANNVAIWDGAAWQPLGSGTDDSVHALAEFNGQLYAGGIFTHADGVFTYRMARWNGAAWLAVPLGLATPDRRCDSLIAYNGELFAGGANTRPSGTQAECVGRWNGATWNYLGGGIDAVVYDLASYDGDLIAGGWFSTAGDVSAQGIARRDSAGQWHSMGDVAGGDGFVFNLASYNGVLLASGSFTAIGGTPVPHNIAQWDGETWQPFGNNQVYRMLVQNGELYACGDFGPNLRVARWDPVANVWQAIGVFPPNSGVSSLAFFNGDLIAGGIGSSANVWRWDFDAPGTWQPIGPHLGFGTVESIGSFNGELLIGGYIVPGGIARFDGTSWLPLGGGTFLGNEAPDESLAVFDMRIYNGELLVAGTFSYVGDQEYMPNAVAAFHVARWNGTNWLALGAGTNDAVVALHEHDGDLVMGGWFDLANNGPGGHFARWGPINPGDLDGDHDVDLTDLATLLSSFGTLSGASRADGDLDDDQDVDLSDLATLLARFGTTCA